jgi:SMODS and SLOG-associating 2TM effector domain 1/SLOG in TRPM, prokaryote/Protein of unknown function (DUF4231)
VLTLRELRNEGVALVIKISASDTPESAAAQFTQKPDGIMLLFGSFDETLAPQVRSVLGRALIPIALLNNAAIIDDGSTAGVAGLMGQAAQQVEHPPILLGICRPNTPGPEPNHSELMRLPAEWPDTAKMSFLIAVELAKSKTDGEMPVIAVLAGGDEEEKLTALRCARHGWPLLIMQGAGGIGDILVAAMASPAADGTKPAPPDDPELQEILDSASIYSFSLRGSTDDIKRALVAPIQKPGEILADAWNRFDVLDEAAKAKQRRFRSTQLWTLSLTVVVTFLAIVAELSKGSHPNVLPAVRQHLNMEAIRSSLHIVMIIVPITIAMLVGLNARFREGNKWILLRAAAEAIKREIFRYRMRSGLYSEAQCKQALASMRLAANIKDITANLVQSEINRTSLSTQNAHNKTAANTNVVGKSDPAKVAERLKFLNAEEYLRDRVQDQINYYKWKTDVLSRQSKRLQVFIVVAGGLGTFLAAIGGEVWVALTAALATAFTSKLEIDQVENSLVQYNMALTNLSNVALWWKGLSPWERTRQKNLDLLVDQTETTLEHETTGWVQQMQSTLDKLTEKETNANKGTGETK